MSTKFEQLLDYLVNEEMDKANELFHEIVVDKSREIYENLIAEEEDEEMDEASEEEDESVEEGAEEEEEEMDESMDLEDSYSMEADDEIGGDPSDDLLGGVEVDGEEGEDGEEDEFGGEEMGHEEGENTAIFDIKNAIAELEAAFAELEQAQSSPHTASDFDGEDGEDGEEDEFGGEEEDGEEMQMGQPAMEGRRMTREYVEKVGNDWEKNSQKTQGQYAGSGSGDKDAAPKEGRSPVSSGKGKPTTGAHAGNILGKSTTADEDGTTPRGKVGGLVKKGSDFVPSGTHNVNNVKSGVKTLTKVAAGHGAEKKGSGPGPVGSGTGEKAGQTSIAPSKPFLKKL